MKFVQKVNSCEVYKGLFDVYFKGADIKTLAKKFGVTTRALHYYLPKVSVTNKELKIINELSEKQIKIDDRLHIIKILAQRKHG